MSTTEIQDVKTPAATTPGTRYPLGWLRALAALAVVTFHAYQHQRRPDGAWPFEGAMHRAMLGTDLFVDMFFVLSAFVLWLPVARDALQGRVGRPGWVMLFRRVARLLPLYVTVVAIVWALTNPSLPGHWQDLLLHLTFTQVYSDQYIFWSNGPAWSLAVEFHFYVLIAMSIPVVHGLTRRFPSMRWMTVTALPIACIAVGLGYLAVRIASGTPEDDYSAWFTPVAKAADFGIGMLLAVACAAGVRLGRAARVASVTLGLGALMALVALRPYETASTNWWHPMFAAAITLTLAAIVLHDGPHPAWMSWRPVAWVGALGYGVYLIHEPVLRFLDFLGLTPEPATGWSFLALAVPVAVVSIALAWLSSRTVEEAGLKMLHSIESDGRARDYYAHVADGRHSADR